MDVEQLFNETREAHGRNQFVVWFSEEGRGKSKWIIENALENGFNRVIFLCATYDLARNQYARCNPETTQLAISRPQKIKQGHNVGFDPVEIKPDVFITDKPKIIGHLKIKYGDKFANQIWNSSEGDKFDMSKKIIISSFNQRWQIQGLDDPKTLLVYDDPSYADFQPFREFKRGENSLTMDPKYKMTLTEHGNDFDVFVKQPETMLDHKINIPVIVTTTEQLTADTVVKELPAEIIDVSSVGKITCSNLYIYGTTATTRKGGDLSLTFFTFELKKLGLPVLLIGNSVHYNAIDSECKNVNLSTCKGRNDLMESHNIIEISKPSSSTCRIIAQRHGITHRQADVLWMAAQTNQAIGRNMNFRDAGYECHVLIDQNYANQVMALLRYEGTYMKNDKVRTDRISEIEANSVLVKLLHDHLLDPWALVLKRDRNKFVLTKLVEEMNLSYDGIDQLIKDLKDAPSDRLSQDDYEVLRRRLKKISPVISITDGYAEFQQFPC